MSCSDSKEKSSCGCGDALEAVSSCPNCNAKGTAVSGVTLKAQLKKEKFENLLTSKDDFNFCNTPKCDTVYYSNDGSEFFNQEDMKFKVAVKNDDPQTPLCYCRRLLKQQVIDIINNKEANIAEKVFEIIGSGKSVCEKTNPRGVCCTQDVTKFLADYGIDYAKAGSCGTPSSKSKFSINTNQTSKCC